VFSASLGVSAVNGFGRKFTAETQRARRLRREKSFSRQTPTGLCQLRSVSEAVGSRFESIDRLLYSIGIGGATPLQLCFFKTLTQG
jgi:hypothetical protein